jgi:hypothetical protein
MEWVYGVCNKHFKGTQCQDSREIVRAALPGSARHFYHYSNRSMESQHETGTYSVPGLSAAFGVRSR